MPELTPDAPAAAGPTPPPSVPTVVPPSRDWQSVVGLFDASEFSRLVDAEVAAARAAEPRPGEPSTWSCSTPTTSPR